MSRTRVKLIDFGDNIWGKLIEWCNLKHVHIKSYHSAINSPCRGVCLSCIHIIKHVHCTFLLLNHNFPLQWCTSELQTHRYLYVLTSISFCTSLIKQSSLPLCIRMNVYNLKLFHTSDWEIKSQNISGLHNKQPRLGIPDTGLNKMPSLSQKMQ